MIIAVKVNNFLKGVCLSPVEGVNFIMSPTMGLTSFVRGKKVFAVRVDNIFWCEEGHVSKALWRYFIGRWAIAMGHGKW